MNGRIAALLLSWVMVFSLIVLIIELAPVVESSDIIYVDDVPGVGPDNPPENYTSIQVAIDVAKDGDTVFVYSGTYYENVNVNKSINLTGEDRDNTTIEGVMGEVVRVRVDWVNVSGFTIMNGFGGIDLNIVQNCRIFNNTIYSNTNNGISLFGSLGNNITGNNVLNNHYGISLSLSSGNNITGNTAYSNDIGISLSDSGENWIVGNNASNNEKGIWLHDSNDNALMNNNASSNSRIGIWLVDSARNNITGSTMIEDGIHIRGRELKHWNTHQIDTSNTVNGKPVYYWKNQTGGEVPAGAGQVILANCTNVIVEGQELTNGTTGIELGFSSNNYIIGNNVSSNHYYGIYLSSSNGNIITGNDAYSNNTPSIMVGISLQGFGGSNENNIIGNNASNNGYGIWVSGSCENNIINNIISNNYCGIYVYSTSIDDSYNNTFVNNIISSNVNIGVWLKEDTSDNLIYHNIFMDNPTQAIDETNNNNQWDNGYPEGGNYWSDFDEPGDGAFDDFNGSDQNIPGSDGVVDLGLPVGGKNPYAIDSDSQDNYPLINPLDTFPPTISNLQPLDASITNDSTPLIGADYNDPSGINVSSVVLIVDGIDVTSSATVTASGVGYTPVTALSEGIHTVYLEVKDIFGNLATASWSFMVDTAIHPPTNLTTKVVNNGNNVELEWNPPSSLSLDHYLIYRADSATEFDFTIPYNSSVTWPDPKNTTWLDPDPNVTAFDDDCYYIVRAANIDESDISLTSNTAGVWTRTFEAGISSFSLPLEPFEARDVEFYCQDMNASYIKWMNATAHTWMKHDIGSIENITLIEVGEGYEIAFLGKSLIQTRYTFTGMPGAMIIYDDNSGFLGFDPDSGAKNLTVAVEPDGNVTLGWQEPASMGPGDWYEVYYSNSRDGFFGTLGIHYYLACPSIGFGTNTTTIPGLGANEPSARLYFMVVPFKAGGIRGASTYSIGIWTEEYLAKYDTFGIPLKMSVDNTADWYCDNIPDIVGINYYIISEQRWAWHSTRMPEGAFDPILVMTEGYQISTSNATKFIFIGV